MSVADRAWPSTAIRLYPVQSNVEQFAEPQDQETVRPHATFPIPHPDSRADKPFSGSFFSLSGMSVSHSWGKIYHRGTPTEEVKAALRY
jgi:hypothetical protein